MGRFYGSIHIRGAGYEAALAACAEAAAELNCRFLMAPEIGGWIGAYPNGLGQDETVSRRIAGRLRGEVLHVQLYHDDVFSYLYFRDGQLADEYNSNPDYFGATSPNAHRVLRGRPEAFSGALPDADLARLTELLHSDARSRPFFAVEAFHRFAALLGLPNASTCYDYLLSGDRQDIEAWPGFVHVPDRSAAEAAIARAEAAAAQALDELRCTGELIAELAPAPLAVCLDGAGGFFVARPWFDGDAPRWPELSRFAPPWQARTAAGLPVDPSAYPIRTSVSGRFLAAGAALWDVAGQRRIAEVAPSAPVLGSGFTRDESVLVTWFNPVTGGAPQQIALTSVPDGRTLRTVSLDRPLPGGPPAALHPSGEILLGPGPSATLNAFGLATGKTVRTFRLAPCAVPSKTPSEELDEMKRLLGNRLISSSEKNEFLQREFRLSDDELPAFLEESARSVQAWLQRLGCPRPAAPEHARRILFSGDGRLLFCTTRTDLRIFDWQAILASNEEFPEPRFRLAPEGHGTDTNGTILALVEDPRRNRLLTGTDRGRIGAVDLEKGSQRTLLEIPGALPIGKMGLSTDGTALYTTLCPEIARTEPGPRKPARFLVWDYSRLEAQP